MVTGLSGVGESSDNCRDQGAQSRAVGDGGQAGGRGGGGKGIAAAMSGVGSEATRGVL